MPDHQPPHDARRALERSKWGDELPPPEQLYERLKRYGFLGAWFHALGAMLLREVPDRLRELATLRTCVRRGCLYGWAGHVLIALHLGLSAEDIAGTPSGPTRSRAATGRSCAPSTRCSTSARSTQRPARPSAIATSWTSASR